MRRPDLRAAALLVAAILALGACGGNGGDPATTTGAAAGTTSPTGDPVTIGLITDLTGRFVSFGTDIQAATDLAVAAVNAEGGINGSPLVVEIADTGGEPDQAVIAYRELADKGVFAISGPLSSGEAEVVFPQAAEIAVPVVTGTANKEGITEPGEGWALRNTATNTDLYTVAIPAWAGAYDIATAVLVFDEQEPVTAAAATLSIPGVAETVGLTIVNADSPITFATGQTDFSSTVQHISEVEADGLIVMAGPIEAGLLARELARQSEERPVIGHPAQGGASFFEQAGTDIDDWVLPAIFNPRRDDPNTQAFVEAMAAADPQPPTVPEAANYHDNILMFAHVMREAGIDGSTGLEEARAAIKDGLLALSGFPGVAGEITFLPSGDTEKTVYVNVVRDGELEPLDG